MVGLVIIMEIRLIDNCSHKFLDVLYPAIEQSRDCRIAVAYVSARGLAMIEPAVHHSLEKGGFVEFLVGLDGQVTEPKALRMLYQMSQNYPNGACYCLVDLGPSVMYHPKLYVAQQETLVTIGIGSSNLTEGGLKQNVEANVWIQTDTGEEIASDAYALYNFLKFHPRRVQPDEEFIMLYEQMYTLRKRESRSSREGVRFQQLVTRFREKITTLPHPVVRPEDLLGWQMLVYGRLPDGPFRTRDLYQFENEFRQYYPRNQNIRAKIRQVLQQLRDLQLIQHVGRETWVKS